MLKTIRRIVVLMLSLLITISLMGCSFGEASVDVSDREISIGQMGINDKNENNGDEYF